MKTNPEIPKCSNEAKTLSLASLACVKVNIIILKLSCCS